VGDSETWSRNAPDGSGLHARALKRVPSGESVAFRARHLLHAPERLGRPERGRRVRPEWLSAASSGRRRREGRARIPARAARLSARGGVIDERGGPQTSPPGSPVRCSRWAAAPSNSPSGLSAGSGVDLAK